MNENVRMVSLQHFGPDIAAVYQCGEKESLTTSNAIRKASETKTENLWSLCFRSSVVGWLVAHHCRRGPQRGLEQGPGTQDARDLDSVSLFLASKVSLT